ncbi:MAG: hypothetical protein RL386_1841 [Bacteroidota bacterium]|jgi:hypothetical protein
MGNRCGKKAQCRRKSAIITPAESHRSMSMIKFEKVRRIRYFGPCGHFPSHYGYACPLSKSQLGTYHEVPAHFSSKIPQAVEVVPIRYIQEVEP